ncbi:hypothetical protein 015DV004_42 [Bacillus phage 015DV004]|nr:hypothetical protein 015DV004_42 [Bacillus phage 015DV004]
MTFKQQEHIIKLTKQKERMKMQKQKELLKMIEEFKSEFIELKFGDDYLEAGVQDLEYLHFGVRKNNPDVIDAVYHLTCHEEINALALEIFNKL